MVIVLAICIIVKFFCSYGVASFLFLCEYNWFRSFLVLCQSMSNELMSHQQTNSYGSALPQHPPQQNQQPRAATQSDGPGSVNHIQYPLLLMLHAYKCLWRERSSGEVGGEPCQRLHCRTTKAVLQHMLSCNEGRECRSELCSKLQIIFFHFHTHTPQPGIIATAAFYDNW